MKKLFFLLFFIPFFLACQTSGAENSTLVVSNNSSYQDDIITAVWTRLYNSDEWLAKWNGSKSLNEDANIYLKPANYDIRVVVRRVTYNTSETLTFETGYKQPVTLSESGYKFIVFDGEGIYDMEN